ncbi:IucA/IucC family protein [Acinetobacter sp. MB5]|uniref:IucA/IucC family protein n=1 Tax=Acinetobacter sp. MB5 TaxID=2069438 RepID=UPI00148C08A9|nr:IucA/IucC family protein [Acinetobacter sp. MB5]
MNTMLRPQTKINQAILTDLINSLLAEHYISERVIFTYTQALTILEKTSYRCLEAFENNGNEQDYFAIYVNQSSSEYLVIPLKMAIKQPWEMKNTILHIVKEQYDYILNTPSILEVMDVLQDLGVFEVCQVEKFVQFRSDLAYAIVQHELSQDQKMLNGGLLSYSPAELFRKFEQYAALRDRPYHPLAKLKVGFSAAEYQAFSPEFQQKIPVCWVAIKKEMLVYGTDIVDIEQQQPARIFLNVQQNRELQAELDDKNIGQEYLTFPIHAWQFEHVLPVQFTQEIAEKTIIPLQYSVDHFYASSSLRSLLSCSMPADCLKLPLAIQALGSLRFLPIVKMINGQKNQKLLQQAKHIDPVLAKRLWLCDENQWWGYLPDQPNNLTADNLTLFDERPMHLAAQRRQIPAELLQEPYQLIPMASLGQSLADQNIFDLILKWQNREPTLEQIQQVFFDLCLDFFEINLRLFRLGLMGEIHGQNMCIVLKNGHFSGLMLRDHDSVRIHLPWMQQVGLDDPHYLSPHNFRITLYHDTVEELLVYLQTLGIQVNLASILESAAHYYDLDEVDLWRVLAQALEQALAITPFSNQAYTQLYDLLFEQQEWPYKQLLRPLLEQRNRTGSMPSSIGKNRNVLKHIMQ